MSASRRVLADELQQGNSIGFPIQSTSMSPSIRPGDVLTVKSADPHRLQQGDILLLEIENEWIVHRLMTLRRIGEEVCVITRGDNADSLDQPVPLDNVLGKVAEIKHQDRPVSSGKMPALNNMDDAVLMASFPSEDQDPPYDITFGRNWDHFLQAADREYLSPLIYFHNRRLMSGNSETPIPSNIASHLQNAFMTSLARNTLFLDELQKACTTLEGIDFILLKGACLALCIYTSPGLRPFSDIDILVKPRDLEKVHSRLLASGYRPFSKVNNPAAIPPESAYLNSIMYTHPDNKISLHVHWRLLNSTLPLFTSVNMNMDDIWNAARKNGNPFLELSPEHLIIHLSEHAVRHSFDRLLLIRDIAEVLSVLGSEIKWDMLVSDCRKFNLGRPVYYSLLMTIRKTAAQVPSEPLGALAPQHPGLGERLFLKLANNGMRQADIGSLVYFSNSGSLKEKARLVWRTAFPPQSVLAQAYNMEADKVGAMIYIKRLLRGARSAAHATGRFAATRMGGDNMNRMQAERASKLHAGSLSYVALWQFMGFILLLCIIWASEIMDLPDLFFRIGHTEINIFRACVTSSAVIICAIIVVGNTYIQQTHIIKGLLIVCSSCQKIRINQEKWENMDDYVTEHSLAAFSHGFCPDCYEKMQKEMDLMESRKKA